MSNSIKCLFLLVLLLLLSGSANAATLTVDDSGGANYIRIQDTINPASAGGYNI